MIQKDQNQVEHKMASWLYLNLLQNILSCVYLMRSASLVDYMDGQVQEPGFDLGICRQDKVELGPNQGKILVNNVCWMIVNLFKYYYLLSDSYKNFTVIFRSIS